MYVIITYYWDEQQDREFVSNVYGPFTTQVDAENYKKEMLGDGVEYSIRQMIAK